MLRSLRPFMILAGVPLLAVPSCSNEDVTEPTAPATEEDVIGAAAPADMAKAAGVGNSRIAFVSNRGSAGDNIYTMHPDGSGLRSLTAGLCPAAFCSNNEPTWSPGGGKIAFSSYEEGRNYEIYVMDRTGNNKRNLTNYAGMDRSPAWAPNGSRIAFSRDNADPDPGDTEIWVVRANGNGSRNLSKDQSADFERAPAWSRDSRRVAWRREQGSPFAEVAVRNADGTGETILLPHSSHPGHPRPDWSPARMQIAYEAGDDDFTNIYISNATGTTWRQLTTTAALCPSSTESCKTNSPRWSPDGRKIAFLVTDDTRTDIYMMNRDGTDIKQLTTAPGRDDGPTWSPDGRKIAFVSNRDGNAEVYVMNADGTGQRNVTNNPAEDTSPDWSP